MELNEIKEIMELFSKCDMDRLDLEQEGIKLKLAKKKEVVVAAPSVVGDVVAPTPVSAPVAAASAEAVVEDDEAGLVFVTSPIVGTFYRAPNPNADAFAKVGDNVRSGQTLCIVEAMKLMNEIQSEYDGEVVKILVENGQGVEFGQRLFALRSH